MYFKGTYSKLFYFFFFCLFFYFYLSERIRLVISCEADDSYEIPVLFTQNFYFSEGKKGLGISCCRRFT